MAECRYEYIFEETKRLIEDQDVEGLAAMLAQDLSPIQAAWISAAKHSAEAKISGEVS